MIVRSLLGGVGVLALAAVGFGFFGPALASGAANAAMTGPGLPGYPGDAAFAGYGLDRVHTPSATTTFRVPRLRCGSADQAIAPTIAALMPGAFDVPPVSAATLFVGCDRGKAYYWPELQVSDARGGTIKNYPTKAAHAGDTIVLHVKYGHVSVVDRTHKFKVSLLNGTKSDEVWIGDLGWLNPTGTPSPPRTFRVAPVPDFGTLTFTNTRLGRRPLGHRGFRSDRQTPRGTLQIKTGLPFNGGMAFRTIFEHH